MICVDLLKSFIRMEFFERENETKQIVENKSLISTTNREERSLELTKRGNFFFRKWHVKNGSGYTILQSINNDIPYGIRQNCVTIKTLDSYRLISFLSHNTKLQYYRYSDPLPLKSCNNNRILWWYHICQVRTDFTIHHVLIWICTWKV